MDAVASPATEAIPEGDSLVIDTSVLIAYLQGDEAISARATHIVDDLLGTGRNLGVVSAVTVGELLVRPLRQLGLVPSPLRTFLLGYPGLTVRSVDFLVAAEAASIRAATSASLADALIAATAVLTASPWLVTADRVLRDRLDRYEWGVNVVLLA